MAVTFAALAAAVAQADEPLGQYFEGLRARRMFTLAEGEALRRLAAPRLSAAERAVVTIELSKTYAVHAAYATGDERAELWDRAGSIVDELLNQEPESPYRALLLTQQALVPAARGAQLRWELELFPLDDSRSSLAASTLREALEQLQPLPALLEEHLRRGPPGRPGGADDAGSPAPALLYRTRRGVDFAMATAWLDLARVLPTGPDRTAALLEADSQFDTLTKVARPDDIAWWARVHRLDVMRLRGQGDRLAGQIDALLKSAPPAAVADAATAVLVRRWLDENRPDEALAALEAHRRERGLAAEELQALVVSTLLSARRVAQEKQDVALSADLLTKAESVAVQLTGPWRTRSQLQLEQTHDEDRYGRDLAVSIREAQWAWQNGDVDGTVAAYTRAAAHAHQQGEAKLAVEFALHTASAQVESGRFEDAVRSLDGLLRAYPQDERAAEADLLRAYVRGRLFEQQPTDERRAAYRRALENHRTLYAGRPTAVEAIWMLARLAEYERDDERVLHLLATIPHDSPRKAAALARSAAILEGMIDSARQRGEETFPWEKRAFEILTPAVNAFPARPTPWSPEQADVASRLARILLHRAPPDFVAADRLLERVIESSRSVEQSAASADASWSTLVPVASQLRIISLAGQGRLADARSMLDQAAADQPGRMLSILNGLTEVAREVAIEHRANLGQLQLELARQLKSNHATLTEDEQLSLDLALAQAHAAIGQWQSAASLYEELLWKQPKNREIVTALARLYEECRSPNCLRQAITQWQTLETLQSQGSVEWLEARFHMASCSHLLGDEETASKLIGVTRVLYPELGTPTLKSRFETLAAEIGR